MAKFFSLRGGPGNFSENTLGGGVVTLSSPIDQSSALYNLLRGQCMNTKTANAQAPPLDPLSVHITIVIFSHLYDALLSTSIV